MTRGQRNNNPLNIRRGSRWLGLKSIQLDKSFCQFESDIYGIRAALVCLRTYHYKYHCNTLREVISRWAPASDGNNVVNYIYMVRMHLKVTLPVGDVYRDIDEDFNVNKWFNPKQPMPIIYHVLAAMAVVESNYILTLDKFEQAVKLL